MKQKMWAYLMNLSDNMWGDPGAVIPVGEYHSVLSVDETVWKETIDFLPSQGFNTVLIDVGDAIQYETHPEISVRGAWSKDRLKKELERMRSMGLTPIPKLNFSACHDAWLGEYSRMLSTSIYYHVCKDVITEVAELFGNPEYFHLGMDEEDATSQKPQTFCCIRQGDLWWHDLYYLFDICEKIGVRPWVWSGYCWNNQETFLQKMPKSALQSNYWYNRMKKMPDGLYRELQARVYCTLNDAGFDQVPCTSFVEGYAPFARETLTLGKEELTEKHLIGYMTAPWRNPRVDAKYTLLDEAHRFALARKEIYPEDSF